jgi:hypothetical protein
VIGFLQLVRFTVVDDFGVGAWPAWRARDAQ